MMMDSFRFRAARAVTKPHEKQGAHQKQQNAASYHCILKKRCRLFVVQAEPHFCLHRTNRFFPL